MSELCEVHFKVKFFTQLSEQIKILGSIPQLGNWDAAKALSLKTNTEQYPFWVSETPIRVKKGSRFEFKCARFVGNSLKQWEITPNGANRHCFIYNYKSTLEFCEGSTSITEVAVQKFMSNDALVSEHIKVRKRVQRSDEGFNPYDAAQNLSLSDDSFSSNDFRSDYEDTNPGNKFKETEKAPKVEVNELSENLAPLLPQRRVSAKTPSKNEGKKSKVDLHDKKPIFKEDFGAFILEGSNEEVGIKAVLRLNIGPSRINSLLKNIELKDDILTKIYERMFADKKQPKFKSTTVVKTFDEHEGLSDQANYDFSQIEAKKLNVVIAVYQLPFSIKFNKDESEKNKRWQISITLEPYLAIIYRFGTDKYQKDIKWIGWPGIDLAEEYQEELVQLLRDEYNAIPIFIGSDVQQKYVDQYCRKVLDSVFCNTLEETKDIEQNVLIDAYRKVNQLFADKLVENNDTQSILLIHNYELLLVPKFLSLSAPKQAIGFIFDTDFPSVENFMRLSHEEELLNSILACDLVCFKSSEHMKSFINTCEKLFNLKYDSQKGGDIFVKYYGRRVFMNIVQNAIEPELVSECLNDRAFEQSLCVYQKKYTETTLMLCATHFHPSEGLLGLIDALQTTYTANPSIKYSLILLPIQGRGSFEEATSIAEYNRLVKEKIAAVNNDLIQQGIHSSIKIADDCEQHECYALMSLSAVFFSFAVTLTADFKALEYIAIRKTVPAAVVRSGLTLGQKNLNIVHKINPNNKEGIVRLLSGILSEKSEKEVEYVFNLDKKFVHTNSAWHRFERVLQELSKLSTIKSSMNILSIKEQEKIKVLAVPERFRTLNFNQIKDAFAKAKNRLVIVNCENVLVDLRTYEKVQNLKPEEQPIITLTKEHIDLLNKFSKEINGQLYIVSSTPPDSLNYWYENLSDLSILAENGFLYKVRKESKWHQLFSVDWSFRTVVQKIMQNYTSRTEGSRMELKESSIGWNCVDVGTQIGEMQIEELKSHLTEVLEFLDHIEILCGNSWIEVKPVGINKGIAAELILSRTSYEKGPVDFVLCIGADSTDEEMYQKYKNTSGLVQDGMLAPNAELFNVVVGSKPSHANYYLNNTSEVYSLISKLLETSR